MDEIRERLYLFLVLVLILGAIVGGAAVVAALLTAGHIVIGLALFVVGLAALFALSP